MCKGAGNVINLRDVQAIFSWLCWTVQPSHLSQAQQGAVNIYRITGDNANLIGELFRQA
jgi:hypothetical protein